MSFQYELTIILPCHNEEKALGYCLQEIDEAVKEHKIRAQVIVSDSSTDRSPKIAQEKGVELVKHDCMGYGFAYLAAFKYIKGKYLLMADADGSYDFKQIPDFLNLLREGNDMVIGNRFVLKMEKNAMPFWNKWVGNPLLSGILRFLYKVPIVDAHCGMRAIRVDKLRSLDMKCSGMEFASEMIVRAAKQRLMIKEIPVNYRRRKGISKLRRLRDGFRHLQFMLRGA